MPTLIDSHTRIEALIARFEPQLQRAFLTLMAQVKNAATLDQIAELLRAGRVREALTAMQRASTAFFGAYSGMFTISATETAVFLTQGLDRLIAYDPIGGSVPQTLSADRIRITRGLTETQLQATSAALIEGTRAGLNPIQQARNFRDSIGLTPGQVESVFNYRRLLENGSSEALRRSLRDRRFDGTIQRSINTGVPPTADQIDRMVARYASRMLDFRARNIAQTEALRGVHEGVHAMYDQTIDNGDIAENDITRGWFTAGGGKVRDTHRPMHGQQRGARVPFTSGGGASLMFPGDPRASAAETVRCRCAVTTRITVREN